MGEIWIPIACLGLIALPFIGHWMQKRWPGLFTDDFGEPDATCPSCHHEAGVDRDRCAAIDEVGGWTSSPCTCQNDYHWRYQSSIP